MSALRAARQVTACSSRLAACTVAANSRFTLAARLPTVAQTSRAAFSSSARVLKAGSSDITLAAKFAEELKFEQEAAVGEEEPEFLKVFKAQGTWQILEQAFEDEVTLTRKFGNEEIRMMFSIADLQSDVDPRFPEQDEIERHEEDEEMELEQDPVVARPLRIGFAITKTNAPGSIQIDALCQDGVFIIENISFFKDAKVGTAITAEADWLRRSLYVGPAFDTLDVGLQEEFEKFLQERGINESLALFVPEYSEYKEQKEYVRWLGNVKQFIEA